MEKTILSLDFLLFVTCIWNVDSRQCRGSFRCCFGYKWSETLRSCMICSVGYTGIGCRMTCPYPYYGVHCQKRCQCTKEKCNIALGCGTTTDKSVVHVEKASENISSELPRNFNAAKVKHADMIDATFPVETTTENFTSEFTANFITSNFNVSLTSISDKYITETKPPVQTAQENITIIKINLCGNFSDKPESQTILFTATIVSPILLGLLVILMISIYGVYKVLKVRKGNAESSIYTEIGADIKTQQMPEVIYSKLRGNDECYTEVV
ncbi:uncharacterized protein LOC134271420 isoform X2 [Saccostrea cucullata]|uniref:uncharacterized protein LOC134271420 isoform X2 n=1 Tax=Saccostrea cuccullata TaxID=36930 RepID=UPI002ED5E716